MSTILHQRELHIAISAEDAAKELADAPHDVQAAFFASFELWADVTGWGDKCRMIADELNGGRRELLARCLETLVEHLREVRPCETCEGTGTVPIRNTVQVDVGPLGKKWPMTVADEVFNEECPNCHGTKVE